jgi:twitching motility two-component system response regulator PilG
MALEFCAAAGGNSVSQAQIVDLVQEGVAAAKGGDKDRARQLLRDALDLDPDNENAHLWLAGIADAPLEALEHLEHVLTLNPDHTKAQVAARAARARAGIAAAKAKDVPLARSLLRHAVVEDPQCEKAWVFLASVAETPSEALHALEQAHALNPANEQTRAALDSFRAVAAAPLEAPPAAPPSAPRKVLVIDDSKSVRRIVSMMLEQQGFQVQSAATWHEGVALMRHGAPDLILLDTTLPDGDGFQLCKLIGQSPDTVAVPVVLMSDSAGLVMSVRGRLAGAAEVVMKSLELDPLLDAVDRHSRLAAS